MNKLTILLLALPLSACFGSNQDVQPTRTVYKVAEVSPEYYECDRLLLPDPETLTDYEVSMLINDLVKENRKCASNMKVIREFKDRAKEILEDKTT